MSCEKYKNRKGVAFHWQANPGNQLVFGSEDEIWDGYKKNCLNIEQFMRVFDWFHKCKARIVVIDLDHNCIKASSTHSIERKSSNEHSG